MKIGQIEPKFQYDIEIRLKLMFNNFNEDRMSSSRDILNLRLISCLDFLLTSFGFKLGAWSTAHRLNDVDD